MVRRDCVLGTAGVALLALLVALPASGAAAARSGAKAPAFKKARSFDVGPSPKALASGDFDADSRLDFAVAGGKEVSVLRGSERGKLTASVAVPLDSPALDVEAVTLPGDGDPDLLVASGGSLLTLSGGAGATFSPTRTLPLSGGPLAALATADLNADGLTDVAASRPNEDDIAVLPGLPDGGFGSPVRLASPGPGIDFGAVVALPLDADALPDLVATRSDGSLSTWITRPGLTFGTPIPTFVGAERLGLTTGDFDGDRREDVAAARHLSRQNQIVVLLSNGQGALRPEEPRKLGSKGGPVGPLATGDFNGDGRADVLAGYARSGKVALAQSKRTGGLGKPSFTKLRAAATPAVEAVPVDADAREDLVALGAGTRSAALNVFLRKRPQR